MAHKLIFTFPELIGTSPMMLLRRKKKVFYERAATKPSSLGAMLLNNAGIIGNHKGNFIFLVLFIQTEKNK